tara:strand:+ start:49 stop:291 length:243 start_codon:yes stop_codon:yes gene_type:complete
MNNLIQAYKAGKALAAYKYASSVQSEEQLTALLAALSSSASQEEKTQQEDSVLSSDERNSKATWGDKINLEPSSATGIQV